MTTQQIFDKVWEHFVTNNQPPSSHPQTGLCYYRGPGGTKCAAGIFIPDEQYSRDLESKVINAPELLALPCFKDWSIASIQFLRDCQSIHDSIAIMATGRVSTSHMKNVLTELAKENKLTIPA